MLRKYSNSILSILSCTSSISWERCQSKSRWSVHHYCDWYSNGIQRWQESQIFIYYLQIKSLTRLCSCWISNIIDYNRESLQRIYPSNANIKLDLHSDLIWYLLKVVCTYNWLNWCYCWRCALISQLISWQTNLNWKCDK